MLLNWRYGWLNVVFRPWSAVVMWLMLPKWINADSKGLTVLFCRMEGYIVLNRFLAPQVCDHFPNLWTFHCSRLMRTITTVQTRAKLLLVFCFLLLQLLHFVFLIWPSLGNHDHSAHLFQESWHVCRSNSCFDYGSSLAFNFLKPDWLRKDPHQTMPTSTLAAAPTIYNLQNTAKASGMTCEANFKSSGGGGEQEWRQDISHMQTRKDMV